MDDFADESVRAIDCMCSAQSCKTVTNMALLGWTIVEDPGPALWVTKSMPEAKKLVKGRLWPMYDKTAAIAEHLPKEKGKRNLLEMYFPGFYLNVTGAENEASLQSTPYRFLFLDEVRQWREGALEMVSKRTRTYPHNHKHLTISCPDMEGDAVHRGFLRGSQHRWFVQCRACPGEFQLEWGEKDTKGGVKWDTNDTTCPDGKWNHDAAAATLRYECPHCGEHYTKIGPNQADRKYFCRHGRWIASNPNAASDRRSYTWNALLPHFTSWEDQFKEFLAALEALHWSDHAPLKDHWNETRGLPWSDRLRYRKDEKFLDQRKGDYSVMDPWPEEKNRFATIDVQAKGGRHFWLCIRAWAHGGASRLLFYDRCNSVEEIRMRLKDYAVPDHCVILDSAFVTGEVYQLVVESRYQWKACRGEDVPHFIVKDDTRGPVKRIFDCSWADPALGQGKGQGTRMIPLYRFSKTATLDRLFLFMYGQLGDWRIHPDVSDEYKRQVTAWDRRYRTNARGEEIAEWYQKRSDRDGGDHATDCERMQILSADAAGLLRPPREGELL